MVCYCCGKSKERQAFRIVNGKKRPYCKACYKAFSKEERAARAQTLVAGVLKTLSTDNV